MKYKNYHQLEILKQEVYDLWQHLHQLNHAVCLSCSPTQDAQDEIRVHEILKKKRVQKQDVRSQHQNDINNQLESTVRDPTPKSKAFFGDLFE